MAKYLHLHVVVNKLISDTNKICAVTVNFVNYIYMLPFCLHANIMSVCMVNLGK